MVSTQLLWGMMVFLSTIDQDVPKIIIICLLMLLIEVWCMVAKVLEAIMIVLFGISWPFNLIKSIRSKTTKGKSLLFIILIDIGYIFGITSKFFSEAFVWSTDWWIFAIYVTNFMLVTADLIIYFINKSRENNIEKTA